MSLAGLQSLNTDSAKLLWKSFLSLPKLENLDLKRRNLAKLRMIRFKQFQTTCSYRSECHYDNGLKL